MNFLRKHWYDVGGVLAVLTFLYILLNRDHLSHYRLLMWAGLISLFLHQLEEYRLAGTFPGMLNAVVYKSKTPDRYPLNAQTAFCINVMVGWTTYFLAALLAEKAVWLGMATVVVSLGNTAAHTTVFNVKGKTLYNAGLLTSWLLFVPCAWLFFSVIHKENLVVRRDYLIGLPLGLLINVVGILKLIDWMADKATAYVFEERNLLPKDRKSSR